MKKLEDYETPATDAESYYSSDVMRGDYGYVVDENVAKGLERKLQMCQDALSLLSNVWFEKKSGAPHNLSANCIRDAVNLALEVTKQ